MALPYPRHLKSSSPQMPVQDNDMKAGIFPGEVIIVVCGKQFATRSISPQPFLPPLAHARLTAGRPARSDSGETADETQQVTKQLANASQGDPEVPDEVEDAVHAALIAETALTDNGP